MAGLLFQMAELPHRWWIGTWSSHAGSLPIGALRAPRRIGFMLLTKRAANWSGPRLQVIGLLIILFRIRSWAGSRASAFFMRRLGMAASFASMPARESRSAGFTFPGQALTP